MIYFLQPITGGPVKIGFTDVIHLLCEAAEVAAQRTQRAGGVARGHSPSNGGLA